MMLFHRRLSSIPHFSASEVLEQSPLPQEDTANQDSRQQSECAFMEENELMAMIHGGVFLNISQGRFHSCYKVRNNSNNNHRCNRTF